MKTRQLTALLLSMALLMFACPALASDAGTLTYPVTEGNLTIDLPSNFMGFLPEFFEEGGLYADSGISKEMQENMFSNNCYLYAFDGPEGGTEIRLHIQEASLPDFSELPASALEMIGDLTIKTFDQSVAQYTHSILECEQTNYLKIICTYQASNTVSLQYATVMDNRMFSLTISGFDTEKQDAVEAMGDAMVASIHYNEEGDK